MPNEAVPKPESLMRRVPRCRGVDLQAAAGWEAQEVGVCWLRRASSGGQMGGVASEFLTRLKAGQLVVDVFRD